MILYRLNRILRFLDKGRKFNKVKGYTLVEAATVVAITGAMAIVAVPIASDKIEDGKISTAAGSTQAIATAFVKFLGDTSNFPIASGVASITSGSISGSTLKVLRSGLSGTKIETDNNLDPDLPTGTDITSGLGLWDTATSSGATSKANAGTDVADSGPFHNLNSHVVSDDVGYGKGGLNWFGPYIPAVDQDPWGRNYLVYTGALDFSSYGIPNGGKGVYKVPVAFNGVRIYGWVTSGGPDEKLQTAPTDSILKGDDIGTILMLPPLLEGSNDRKSQTTGASEPEPPSIGVP